MKTDTGQIVNERIEGQIVDLKNSRIFSGSILAHNGLIAEVKEHSTSSTQLIVPPLVDAHMHVESTLCSPAQIGAELMKHGVLASVSDPHEIANVLGVPGIDFMLEDAKRTVFRFMFGAPSCVPATNPEMESSGAILRSDDVARLLERAEIGYLAEVMNFPGVLNDDPELMKMIAAAKRLGKPVDGHAPGLSGEAAVLYASHGITTDHECFSLEEALWKIRQAGQHVLIREGSAARNLDALARVIELHPAHAMLCSDDLHPDLAIKGSINQHVRRLIEMGMDPLNVLKAACSNPNKHYGLGMGQLQHGDSADFIIVSSLKEFYVKAAVRAGRLMAKDGQSAECHAPAASINNFSATPISLEDLKVPATGNKIRVIEISDGQLVTGSAVADAKIKENQIVSDVSRDILKIAVVNRYQNAPVSVGFVKNFGLRQGALASSVAHDCHNVIAVGVSDEDLLSAINKVIRNKGGLSFAFGREISLLPLPIAGLMSDRDVPATARMYSELDGKAKNIGGSTLRAPFMTLSFMGLIVIPKLKLSDKGLFEDFVKVPLVLSE